MVGPIPEPWTVAPQDATVRELVPGLWSLRLPLAWQDIPHVNAFVIARDDGAMLVDCGSAGSPEAWDALVDALEATGHGLPDVRLLVGTHAHSDHIGLAARVIEESGCAFWMHPATGHFYDAMREPERVRAARRRRAVAEGVPEHLLGLYEDVREETDLVLAPREPDAPLRDGLLLPSRLGPWEVLETPGHAPSHVCLYQRERRLLLAVDLVSAIFAPYFDYGYSPDPVAEFLASLERVGALPVELTAPGHGRPLDLAEAVARHREGVAGQLAALQDAVRAGPAAAYELTARVFGPPRSDVLRVWELGQVIAYLRHLRLSGRVVRETGDDGRFRYRPGDLRQPDQPFGRKEGANRRGGDMTLTVEPFQELFIGGAWRPPAGAGWIDVTSPASGEVVGRAPEPTVADADAAVAAARHAFDDGAWRGLTPAERGDYVARFRDQLAARVDEFNRAWVAECGPTLAHAAALDGAVVMMLDDLVARAGTLELTDRRTVADGVVEVVREPVGVAVIITTWNGPALYMAMKVMPALVAGCTVVVKTAPESQLTTRLLAEMVQAAGFPEGTVSMLSASTEVGEHLVRHPDVDKVSLTGSVSAGRAVMAACAPRIADVTLELGGKSPAVVLPDADLDAMLDTFIPGFIAYSGQICAALTRLIVPRARHDEIVAAVVERLSRLRVGDPLDPESDLGPLASRRQLERVEEYVRSGLEEGATLVLGGGRTESRDEGFYFDPTVFTAVTPDMRIAREEIFGPLLCVLAYDDVDEAVRIANATQYGLAASVYGGDPDVAAAVARRIQSGTVAVNAAGVSLFAPFGGVKQSGLGRECGTEGIEEYLQTKSVKVG